MTYEEYMKQMSDRTSLLPEGGVDFSQETMAAPRPDNTSFKPQAHQMPEAGPSDLKKTADETTAAGAFNPYLAGAGLAMQGAAMIQQGKRDQRNSQYQAALNKFQARQNAISQMAQLGAGLKA